MSEAEYKGPAFLKELSPDAVMTAAFLRKPVNGSAAIIRLVSAAASTYASMAPQYKGGFSGKEFIGFKAILKSGEELHGLVAMSRGADNLISELDIWHSPLGGLVALSTGVAKIVGEEFGSDMFL